jgi:hypothetical protein
MKRREALALIAAGAASTVIARALAKGDVPTGVNQVEGLVHVNGEQAHVGTPVRPGDRVSTSQASSAVIVVGSDAFLLRSNTRIELGKSPEGLTSQLRVAAGGVLSVFSKKPLTIKAATASIGIRGTGAYLEMQTAGVYFCLCYGEAVIDGPGMASSRNVKTTHHEEPLLITDVGGAMRIAPGPFMNHTDAELAMLEALVGREPPFTKGGMYPANKY